MASIKRNIVYNILLTTSQVAFSLISLPYISRVMGPYQLGRVSFVDSATQYFIICASLGIPIYGIREIAQSKSDKNLLARTFSELIIIQFITSCVLFVIYFFIILFADRFKAEKELFHLGLIQLLLSSFVTDWFFQGVENYANVSIRSFIIRFVSIILILVFVKKSTDTYLYYLIWTSAVVINVILSVIPCFRYFTLKNLDLKKHLKPILTFFSTKFVTSVYVVLLSFFVGYLQDKSYVAYFSSAYKICLVSLTFILAFSSVLIPKLSDYYQNKRHEETIRLLSKNFNVIINYSIPLVFILIFFSEYLVRIMLGNQFLLTRTDLVILAPLILIISLSSVFSMNVLTPIGQEGKFLKATVVGMLVNLAIVFILIPLLKDVGAAIALLITESVVCVLLGFYSKKYLTGIFINYRVIAANIFNCIISFGLIRYLLNYAIRLNSIYVQFIVQLGLCAGIYVVLQLFVVKDPFLRELFSTLKNKMETTISKNRQAVSS